MKAEYINPFLDATVNVVTTMAATDVTPGKAELKQGNFSFGVVTGIIGLVAENVTGNMVVSFDKPSILSIVSNMLFEQFTEVNDEVVDAVGELTNMICGGAKKSLSELGIKISMAVPITILGENVEIRELGKGPALTIPFETPKGKFVVEASLHENK